MRLSEPIRDDHDLGAFDSGNPALDSWLRTHALTAEARGTGRTFVWHDEDTAVLAYYTIVAHVLARDDLPKRLGRGLPAEVPAVLLARLALDVSLHGRGVGGALLAEALGRIVAATEVVAARFVVVDAIDEAAAGFYEHHGFRRIPGTDRLVQRIADVAAALRGPLGVE